MVDIVLPSQKGAALNTTEFEANHKRQVTEKTGAYTTVVTDNRDIIEANTTSNITLGDASDMIAASDTGDYQVGVSCVHASGCTVVRSSTDTIDGETSISIAQYESMVFKANNAGNGYSIIGHGGINSTITTANVDDLTVNTTATFSGATIADLGTVTTADINGGTVDGTTIGGTTPAAGTFTTLSATGGGALTGTWSDLGTVTTVNINGGAVDGTTIGGTTPAAGTFTTANATTLQQGGTDTDDLYVGKTGDTMTGDLGINASAPTVTVDALFGDAVHYFRDNGTARVRTFWDRSRDSHRTIMYDTDGVTERAVLELTETGDVDVTTGTFKIGGTAADDLYVGKTGDQTMTGDLTISKSAPYVYLDSSAGDSRIYYRDGSTLRGLMFWDRSSDAMSMIMYDTNGSTPRVTLSLKETGEIELADSAGVYTSGATGGAQGDDTINAGGLLVNGNAVYYSSGTDVAVADGGTGVSAMPSFKAKTGGGQTISNASEDVIQFSDEDFDTESDYDTANYKFTPSVAGKYQVNVAVYYSSTSDVTAGLGMILRLYSNATVELQDQTKFETAHQAKGTLTLSALVDMNGTTDTLEVRLQNTSGADLAIGGTASYQSQFSASWVGP